ncbi:hypothetical protein V2O64_25210 (plasmid) [Verrucomicrobiaceae bacterium 227]
MNSKQNAIPIYSFIVRSGSPRDIPMFERTIFLGGNANEGFRLWGNVDGEENVNDLSEILLEDALSSDAPGDLEASEHVADGFSHALARSLARHVSEQTPTLSKKERAKLTLDCLMHSLDANYTEANTSGNHQYNFSQNPIREAAKRTGIDEIALAEHALHTLLQETILAIDPSLQLTTPNDGHGQISYALSEKPS